MSIKKIFEKLRQYDFEKTKFEKLIYSTLKADNKVLDLGCGFGRVAPIVMKTKASWVGCDINKETIKKNNEQGFTTISFDELQLVPDQTFDMLILSHIIEHFAPSDLITFLNQHLRLVKNNGWILIATPLENYAFNKDFDHIKSYHPYSITQFFSTKNQQISYQSSFSLTLHDLYYINRPLELYHFRSKYIHTIWSKPLFILDTLLILFSKLTRGAIGIKSSWVGMFKLCNK